MNALDMAAINQTMSASDTCVTLLVSGLGDPPLPQGYVLCAKGQRLSAQAGLSQHTGHGLQRDGLALLQGTGKPASIRQGSNYAVLLIMNGYKKTLLLPLTCNISSDFFKKKISRAMCRKQTTYCVEELSGQNAEYIMG